MWWRACACEGAGQVRAECGVCSPASRLLRVWFALQERSTNPYLCALEKEDYFECLHMDKMVRDQHARGVLWCRWAGAGRTCLTRQHTCRRCAENARSGVRPGGAGVPCTAKGRADGLRFTTVAHAVRTRWLRERDLSCTRLRDDRAGQTWTLCEACCVPCYWA